MTERDHRRLAAIVAADVVGYSLLMGRDESGTLARLKAIRHDIVDPKVGEYDGRIVKTTGDGLLLEFPSVVDAVRFAVDVQREVAELGAAVPDADRIRFRIGINVGDIIIDGDDIFGDGVNVAARLQTLAEPGGICVSRAVRDQVLDKLSFAFDDLGPQEVKNIVRPVEVFRVALDVGSGAAPAAAVGMRTAASPRADSASARAAGGSRAARLWGLGAVVVLTACAGAWWGVQRFLPPAKIAPYSLEDRRKTFAVLPFTAAAGDATGARVAAAMTDAVNAAQEARPRWAQVAPRRKVDEALAKNASPRDLGQALDVHFLVLGNVTRAASGYAAEVQVVDAATERVLGSRTLAVAEGATTVARPEDTERVVGSLTFQALKREVERARSKPDADLDVRDLSFRAFVDWGSAPKEEAKPAYKAAMVLLDRARKQAPDDLLATSLVAEINLCDCVEGWSTNIAEQQALGAAALEDWLRRDPTSTSALGLKAHLYALRGQYEESIVIADTILKRDPQDAEAMATKAFDLLRLGHPQEAQAALADVAGRSDDADVTALAAAIAYALGRDDEAARLAQRAVALMNADELRNRSKGSAILTLIAAEARLGHADRAKAGRAKFAEVAPGVDSIAAVKAWMHPAANLVGFEPLFEGLRQAGFS